MKDTLRKKSGKTDSNNENDLPSNSSEAPSNPWASETSSAVNGDAISRQASKASKSPDPNSPQIPPIQEKTPSPPPSASKLEFPGGENGTDGTETSKPTRRRKTITKSPHTFELEADLNPVKKEQAPPPTPEVPKTESPAPALTPAPKKKKRVSQGVAPETPTSVIVNSVPSIQPTPATPTSPKAMPAPPLTPSASAQYSNPNTPSGPTSPRPPSTTTPVNPFTAAHRPKKSLSFSTTSSTNTAASSNPCRFTPPRLPNDETFHGKVIVLTNGASQTGQALIRQFHAAGCRIIFGDTSTDQARRLISSLPPPHVVHFNRCDMTSYADMLDLFKLATTMYGRVDHAIFGVGDDGGQARSVGEAERGWFDHDRRGSRSKTFRMAVGEIEKEPVGLADTLTASIRFARIAMAYLKYSPKSKQQKKKQPFINPYASPPRPDDDNTSTLPGKDDRSLTFVTSVAAFKETPGLPIYQVTQHGILGLVRSLRSTVDPDPERGDGVRINAVVTNVMVPRALAQTGGRMSVQLPPDRPEDVARVVAGVVATSSANSVSATVTTTTKSTKTTTTAGSEGTGMNTNGGGIWYEKGFERGVRERFLHGRVIYSVGAECWDVQEGLDRSESVWIGTKPAEALNKGIGGLSGGMGAARVDGEGSSWILDLA
ncbi:hypothetical protein LTS13_006885 [Exophiala xenobiotica]|nr:hypothetical protein LTS13_006885 [Exophiala xenobiotica]